jgi:rod shape-determining protein MreC
LSHVIKLGYLNQLRYVDNIFTEHFNQAKSISQLQKKNQFYEKELLSLHHIAQEYQNLLYEQNSSIKLNAHVELTRTLSYVRMGDPYRIWLTMPNFDPKKVYGLLYRGYVAGIVVSYQNHPMALLNGDLKSTYAVFVGSTMAPGIARGNNTRSLMVEFIPTWIPISVGDEVTTSGLDNIFLSGLKVGKVTSIVRSGGYQSATIEPYFYGKNPTYFHVITQIR